MARKNKTKNDVVSDIQLSQDAERRRALIRDIIFPYLVSLDENIAYSKIFLQSFAGLIEGVYEENRKKTTVDHISPRIFSKLDEIFASSKDDQKKEKDKYLKLVDLLKDVSIQDLAYAAELPRYIDGFLLNEKVKEKITSIPIDKILG